jgi:hypothetical protein
VWYLYLDTGARIHIYFAYFHFVLLLLLLLVTLSLTTGTRIPDPLFPHLVPPAIMVWIFVWKYIFEPFIHILQHFVLQLSRSTNFCFHVQLPYYRHSMCFRGIHFIFISTAHALFLTCLPVSIYGT